MPCIHEAETIRALHTGSPSLELLQHQESCRDCREALQVAQLLRRDARDLRERVALPSALQLLAVAQRRRHSAMLARTRLFLRILKASGVIYAAVFVLWAVHAVANLSGGFILTGLNGKALETSIAGAIIAVLFVAFGLSYTLRRERRYTA